KRCDAEQLLNERSFGMAVKAVREINDITQAELARRTGISERQLRRYETAGMKPRISSLSKLAKAHKMSLGQYLDRLAEVVSGALALVIRGVPVVEMVSAILLENELHLSQSESAGQCLCLGVWAQDHEIWFWRGKSYRRVGKCLSSCCFSQLIL
ncbi:MAG: helix-turn-helix transcriptional regulator, partial [Candidatus Obscuribacter sp.]|nr:helix-turn-helix transcriptional regulator [Candidatus Obscuribacter sp.]